MADEKKNPFDQALDALTRRRGQAPEAKPAAKAPIVKKPAPRPAASDQSLLATPQQQKDTLKQIKETGKGVVCVKSLRVRQDHSVDAEVVAGLAHGKEVTVHETWSDGKSAWAKVDQGWAAIQLNDEIYMKPAA